MLLADRALSRLLKKQWPRALVELGTIKSDSFAACSKSEPHRTCASAIFISGIGADEIYHRNDNIYGDLGVCTFARNDDVLMVLRNAAIAGGDDDVSSVGSAGFSTIYTQSLSVACWADAAFCVFSPMNYPPG